jgi:hypothetical protein
MKGIYNRHFAISSLQWPQEDQQQVGVNYNNKLSKRIHNLRNERT